MRSACALVGVRLRGQLEVLCFLAFVCVSTIVYYRKVFGTVILVAEIGHLFMQSRFPALGGDLEEVRLKVEVAREQLPQFIHLIARCKPVVPMYQG